MKKSYESLSKRKLISKIVLLFFVILFSYQSFSQRKEVDYKLNVVDSGFLFLIAPHDHFLFVPSTESNIEGLFKSNSVTYYLLLHLNDISTDNYNKLLLQQNKLKIGFKGETYALDSINYARIYLKFAMPLNQIGLKERLARMYLKSKFGIKKLHYFTKSEFEFFEVLEVLEVL